MGGFLGRNRVDDRDGDLNRLRFIGFLAPAVAAPIVTWHVSRPFLGAPHQIAVTQAQIWAVVAIVLVTLVNYLSVRLGAAVQVALTAIKIGAILAVVLLGFALGSGAPASVTAVPPIVVGGISGFLTALVGALWAYDGWQTVALVGSEVVRPQRNIPISLVGGALIVGTLYILANAVCFYVRFRPGSCLWWR